MKGGGRDLVVVPIKSAEAMSFTQFWSSYEQVVRKARTGVVTAEEYAGSTISLTNPGGIGTNHSVPRLMSGQSAIVGVGALEYPAEFQGASDQTLSELGISKIITLTSTYDHASHRPVRVRSMSPSLRTLRSWRLSTRSWKVWRGPNRTRSIWVNRVTP